MALACFDGLADARSVRWGSSPESTRVARGYMPHRIRLAGIISRKAAARHFDAFLSESPASRALADQPNIAPEGGRGGYWVEETRRSLRGAGVCCRQGYQGPVAPYRLHSHRPLSSKAEYEPRHPYNRMSTWKLRRAHNKGPVKTLCGALGSQRLRCANTQLPWRRRLLPRPEKSRARKYSGINSRTPHRNRSGEFCFTLRVP